MGVDDALVRYGRRQAVETMDVQKKNAQDGVISSHFGSSCDDLNVIVNK